MNNTQKAIYFDMDGTIADLYSVEDWEALLNAEDTTPYEVAEPIGDMTHLNKVITELSHKGVKIGVISWGSLAGTAEFNRKTKKAKKDWLDKHFAVCDEIHVVKYGTPKHKIAAIEDSILVDDNPKVLADWPWKVIDASDHDVMVKELEAIAARS